MLVMRKEASARNSCNKTTNLTWKLNCKTTYTNVKREHYGENNSLKNIQDEINLNNSKATIIKEQIKKPHIILLKEKLLR